MVDINSVIAGNILAEMKKKGRKQTELAGALNVSKQTMSKMLCGSRMISAPELHRIAEFLCVTMEELVKSSVTVSDSNVVRAFMGSFESQDAQDALKLADELADMIIFHANVRENTESMFTPRKA